MARVPFQKTIGMLRSMGDRSVDVEEVMVGGDGGGCWCQWYTYKGQDTSFSIVVESIASISQDSTREGKWVLSDGESTLSKKRWVSKKVTSVDIIYFLVEGIKHLYPHCVWEYLTNTHRIDREVNLSRFGVKSWTKVIQPNTRGGRENISM